MMRSIIVLLVAMLLTGCGSLGDTVRLAREANDSAVHAAEFTLCQGASIGAIRRAYGSAERAQVWRFLCNSADHLDLTAQD